MPSHTASIPERFARLVRTSWTPPSYPDAEQTQIAVALHITLWVALAMSLIVLATMALLPGTGPYLRYVLTLGLIAVICLVSLGMNSRGKTRAASIVLVSGFTVVVTALALTAGGVHSMAMYWYLTVVFGAGLLLGGTAGIITAVCCGVLGLAMVLLELVGYLPASFVRPTPFSAWLTFIEIIATILTLQYFAARTVRTALEKTKEELHERMRAEEALRVSQTRYRTLFESAADAIFLMDETAFIECNPKTLDVFRCTREQIIGKHPAAFSPPSQPDGSASSEKSQEKIRLALAGQPQTFEWVHCRQDGSPFDAEVSLNRVDLGADPYLQAIVRNITDRRQAEVQIKAQLQEKELLLKEIHHRVKNNMQVVTSLLNLQSTRLTDNSMKEVFIDSQNRIRSMALIHELLYYSHVYGSVNFIEYCKALVTRLLMTYRAANVALDMQDGTFTLGLDQAIPCGLMTNEMVSNALKHAFPDGRKGRITIRIGMVDSDCLLTVSDDGVGFPEGATEDGVRSFGLQIIDTLTKQLDGELTITRDPGTTFTLRFPYSKP